MNLVAHGIGLKVEPEVEIWNMQDAGWIFSCNVHSRLLRCLLRLVSSRQEQEFRCLLRQV